MKIKKNAFTIFELLVVLAVIGVFAVIAYPNIMSWITDRQVRGETYKFVSEIERMKAKVTSKEGLYWYTVLVARKIKSELLKANAWHHRTDAFSSIVVIIGIIGAANGFFFLDSVAAIVVGIMIIYIGWRLGFEATKELVDTSITIQFTTMALELK